MIRLLFGVALATLAMIQATILPAVNLLGIGPNLVLVLILIWSAQRGTYEGLLWAFPLGVLLDLLALDPLGSNALALLPVALIGGLTKRPPLHSGLIVPMLGVVLATVAHQVVVAFVGLITGQGYPFTVTVRLSLLTAMLNLALVPVFYLIMMILERVGVVRAART